MLFRSDVNRRNVMTIAVGADNRIYCDGSQVSASVLRSKVALFVENRHNSPDMPEKIVTDIPLLGRRSVTSNHVICIQADRDASYETYFNMQNAIVLAYSDLRDKLARASFGRPYSRCTKEQREAVAACYPMRMAETVSQGGGR